MRLSIDNIDIIKGERVLLKAVNLSFDKPELVGIIGKNGSGKSSLLRLLVETEAPNTRGKKIAWLPQIVDVPADYAVYEFLRLSRYPYRGEPLTTEEDAINKSLAVVCMTEYRDRLFGSLSGGERQRILIAGLLAQETEIILADEPTTFLDPLAREEVFKLLKQIVSTEKKLIVVVTHDIDQLTKYAEKILMLKDQRAEFIEADDVSRKVRQIYE